MLGFDLCGVIYYYIACKKIHLSARFYFQILGLCCAIAGLVMGVVSVSSSHFRFVHAIVGIVALGLGVLQPVNAIL